MIEALNNTIYHRIHNHHYIHNLCFGKKRSFLLTVYKPNIAKTVYIFVLHSFMYKNKL